MKPRYAIPLAALVAGGLVLATGRLSPRPSASPSTPATSANAPLFDIPEFSLLDQDNKPFTLHDLRGKVWVADFMFTGCAGACPVLSEKMARFQKEIANPRVHLVSIDVDPDHDTPAMLKEYGAKYHADFSRWHFLASPSRAAAFSLARALHVTDQPDDRNYQLLHSDNFYLVDAEGKVRGIYDSNKPQSLDQLRADLAKLP